MSVTRSFEVLSRAEILATAAAPGPCVYFLFGDRGEILYIGQSIRILDRIRSHQVGAFRFSDFRLVPCPERDLLVMEALYIREYSPPHNGRAGRAPRKRFEPLDCATGEPA